MKKEGLLLLLLVACSTYDEVKFQDQSGTELGTARIAYESKDGVPAARIYLTVSNLPPGEHGFHIHENALCEGNFSSAGAHYNPNNSQHGILNPKGAHTGDLQNIVADESGRFQGERVIRGVIKDELHTKRSLIIHEKPDDYVTDPSGNAGARIACAVI